MSTNHRRANSKEQFWRRLMREWSRSGLSVRAFCEQHGLAVPTFYAWRRILAERDATADAAATRFVPVQVIAEPLTSPARSTESPPSPGAALELVLGGSRRLRVAPGFDGPTLQRLLTLLEERQP